MRINDKCSEAIRHMIECEDCLDELVESIMSASAKHQGSIIVLKRSKSLVINGRKEEKETE